MFEFKLPDLGEGVAEGEILKWYVEVGGEVTEDEPLVDIETDKAAVTIPSPKGGVLKSVAGDVGDSVDVGSVLCTIEESGAGDATGDEDTKKASAKKNDDEAPDPKDKKAAAKKKGDADESDEEDEKAAAKKKDDADEPEKEDEKAASRKKDDDDRRDRRPAAKDDDQRERTAASRDGVSTRSTAEPRQAVAVAPRQNGGPVPAAPATRRIARELGVDIGQVPGSGPAGRITAEDVRLFAEGGIATSIDLGDGGQAAGAAGSGIPYYELERMPDFDALGPVEREPVRSIRRKVAKKMVTSMVTVPHVAHMDDADVTELEGYRKRLKAEGGPNLTLMAFVIKALTRVLADHRMLNASLDPQAGEIVYKRYYNIGFAADTPQGLLVPVVKNADRLSTVGISDEIRRLAEAARERAIEVKDLQDGTFTVTNVGAIGGSYVIPTINYPECAILGMGRTQERAVVRGGEIVARTMLPLCITYDHRVVDGADGARFMNQLVRYLSDPVSWVSEMV